MLPFYKLLSLLLRVFSRPLINLTKRYHATNPLKQIWIRRRMAALGEWFHQTSHRITRKYLRVVNPQEAKPLSEPEAVERGIEFFYELLFYSIAIGFPTYEIWRNVHDTALKTAKTNKRIQQIESSLGAIQSHCTAHSHTLLYLQQQTIINSAINNHMAFINNHMAFINNHIAYTDNHIAFFSSHMAFTNIHMSLLEQQKTFLYQKMVLLNQHLGFSTLDSSDQHKGYLNVRRLTELLYKGLLASTSPEHFNKQKQTFSPTSFLLPESRP